MGRANEGDWPSLSLVVNRQKKKATQQEKDYADGIEDTIAPLNRYLLLVLPVLQKTSMPLPKQEIENVVVTTRSQKNRGKEGGEGLTRVMRTAIVEGSGLTLTTGEYLNLGFLGTGISAFRLHQKSCRGGQDRTHILRISSTTP